jgi:hypothetical protein
MDKDYCVDLELTATQANKLYALVGYCLAADPDMRDVRAQLSAKLDGKYELYMLKARPSTPLVFTRDEPHQEQIEAE